MFSFLAIPFPMIDPVLLQLGPVAIRWYSLSYIAGILLGWWYAGYLNKKPPIVFSKKAYDDVVVWIILGIILGGRLGYILFYNLPHYLESPAEMLAVWQGGMSFHGGMIGLVTAMYIFSRKHNMRFLALVDIVSCVAPIGIFLGRIANFINGELYGRTTDVPWAVIFPRGGDLPRHPSQIYEALLEGLAILLILFIVANFTKARQKEGMLSGMFLVFYGIFRCFVEFFREPDAQLGFIFGGITMGQLLCIPMILLGIGLIVRAIIKNESETPAAG